LDGPDGPAHQRRAALTGAVGAPPAPSPLGATCDGADVHFAIFSQHAEAIELCLFAPDEPARETGRVGLVRGADAVWRTRVGGVAAGTLYGYRVHGPFAPRDGHRFNPAKLLVDPYARAITPLREWSDRLLGHVPGRPEEDLARDERDDADVAPRAIVVDSAFDWGGDRPPCTPWDRTVIYEAQCKGMTARHPAVAAELRGTYLGFVAPPVLEHLVGLGVTAVELLPIHHVVSERHLARLGLTNYWGYNTLGFFAPDARFASAGGRGEQVREFQTLVRTLHRIGIEVILDVVYNHTAEGDRLGPTLGFRGIDNRTYYRLTDGDRRDYVNYTGCGNTLDLRQPAVRALVVDSLRYWVEIMHVDGFRFDLASALARDPETFDAGAALFTDLRAEPALADVKLIAEPWDATADGYRLGAYPPPWREWNDRYRDGARRWWHGEPARASDFATRLCGSLDVFGGPGRGTTASVNFITAHDGFSLRDLVSYNRKHNEANGEAGRDGTEQNWSWNCGAEGASDDADIRALRARQQRNLLATLLLSRGVPMLRAGDEIGQTQDGNNNAYCQDNPTTWLDWEIDDERAALLAVARRLTSLVRRHPALRAAYAGPDELVWHEVDGSRLGEAAWHDPERRTLALCVRADLLLLVNAGVREVTYTLPAAAAEQAGAWAPLFDSLHDEVVSAPAVDGRYRLAPRSLALLARGASNPC
jgi:glycogen operon protein